MLSRCSEDVWSRFVFELVIWLKELNPWVRCAFGNVLLFGPDVLMYQNSEQKTISSDAKVLGLAMLEGLQATEHSLARSHYWPPRGLLAAGFSPWPGSPLIKQPEPLRLLGGAHVDASLSADAGSTWPDDQQGSLPQAIPSTCLLVAGLQEHATTPGNKQTKLLPSQQARSLQIKLAGSEQVLQTSVSASYFCHNVSFQYIIGCFSPQQQIYGKHR